jgi:hypothetical protein
MPPKPNKFEISLATPCPVNEAIKFQSLKVRHPKGLTMNLRSKQFM